MKTILKNVFALVAGLLVGGLVNMGIIIFGGMIIPPPPGVDVTSVESLKATMHLFELQHFITPFLAHAIGTLVGAVVAAKLAVTHKFRFALTVGVFFLIGGIANVFMLPAPLWFAVLDLVLAYIPMGWLGYRIVTTHTSAT